MLKIEIIKTGSTLVSSAVPNRATHKNNLAYTGLFQKRSSRISVPVKCFYVTVNNHSFLIDTGWSKEVVDHPIKHLGFGLWFASEPVMKLNEAAINQLVGKRIDSILMTHLDCDHASGLKDFKNIPIYTSKEEIEYSNLNKIRYGKLAKGYDYHILEFKDDINAPFNKSVDVFNDGSVVAYLTPTHSAGSIIYKIIEENKFVLVVGDNGYSRDSWENGLLPGPLFNKENMIKCLAWIKQQEDKNECIGIYCAHDPIDRLLKK